MTAFLQNPSLPEKEQQETNTKVDQASGIKKPQTFHAMSHSCQGMIVLSVRTQPLKAWQQKMAASWQMRLTTTSWLRICRKLQSGEAPQDNSLDKVSGCYHAPRPPPHPLPPTNQTKNSQNLKKSCLNPQKT